MKFTLPTAFLFALAVPTATAKDVVPSSSGLRGATSHTADANGGVERRLYTTSCGHEFCTNEFPMAVGATFRIRSPSVEGMCLDWSSSSDNNVKMHDCNGGDNQAWTYDSNTRAIKSVQDTGMCLDLSGDSNIQVFECHGKRNQDIRYTKKEGTDYGFLWTKRDDSAENKCFDVHHADNENVYAETGCGSSSDQEYYFEELDPYTTSCGHEFCTDEFPVADGTKFRIRSPSVEGMCLDWGSGDDNVKMYDCHDGDNQAWTYDSDTRAIKSVRDSGMCLDLSGDSNIQVHECHGERNQDIRYTKKEGTSYGFLWTKRDNSAESKCFDVHHADNENVYAETSCGTSSDQEYYFEERKGEYYQDSYFEIKDTCTFSNARMKYGCINDDKDDFVEYGEIRRTASKTVSKYYCPEDKPNKAVETIIVTLGVEKERKYQVSSFKWHYYQSSWDTCTFKKI